MRLKCVDELCTYSGGRVSPSFVVFAKEFGGGADLRRIVVCWSGVCEDQEQRSYLRRAQVRLRIAG